MSEQMRIHRQLWKNISSHSAIPAPNPLKNRGFGKGMQARSAELPTTNLWQTRPVSPLTHQPSQAQKKPDLQTQLKQAEKFGYQGLDVPTFAPRATAPLTDPSLAIAAQVANGLNQAVIDNSPTSSLQPKLEQKTIQRSPTVQNAVDPGKITQAAEDLREAMAGWGTDEETIIQTLKDQTPTELAAIEKEYLQKYGRTLDYDLRDDGLVFLDDRFAWFPKPWRILSD